MNDGLIFYWLAWAGCIIVACFMPEGKTRTTFTCFVLILILFADVQLPFGIFHFSLSYVVLLTVTFYQLARLNRFLFSLLVSFTIMIGYTGLLIWYMLSPIGLFLPKIVWIPLFILLLTIWMIRTFRNRLFCCIAGIVGGEWLYSLILTTYSFSDVIGDMVFLDTVSIVTAALIGQHLLNTGTRKLNEQLKNAALRRGTFIKKKAQ
ncbi:hypothetical protein GCM10008983_21920 [Lentibacillus halophilus]|uniref:Uncharacterized protein n=1 Tax=Lentibacillus halophilus TaxID=295065 RepID=A0ABN0ZDE7_9BACI